MLVHQHRRVASHESDLDGVLLWPGRYVSIKGMTRREATKSARRVYSAAVQNELLHDLVQRRKAVDLTSNLHLKCLNGSKMYLSQRNGAV